MKIEPGKRKILMLVGIQGSGKTTASGKLAKYFQKRGLKTADVNNNNPIGTRNKGV